MPGNRGGKLWSYAVANDPKHKPQVLDQPATTARREWSRWPQEAHILDESKERYRRLSIEEIATIQGFAPDWVNVAGVSTRDRISALGNAVPPPLAAAIGKVISKHWAFQNPASVEICAGIGGLSFAASEAGLTPAALIENWEPACSILRAGKPWDPTKVFCDDVTEFDFSSVPSPGMLLGGPPCQPWSHAGAGLGQYDSRDLLGYVPRILTDCAPEIFLLENVPGLFTRPAHKDYLEDLIRQLSNPRGPVKYGVALALLTAADFGVPQVRRRLFILGFKERAASFANEVLVDIQRHATHSKPSQPVPGTRSWVTLREAFSGLSDPGGWKALPKKDSQLKSKEDNVEEAETPFGKIEMNWPGKNLVPVVKAGKWALDPNRSEREYRPLLRSDAEEAPGLKDSAAVVVEGDITNSLDALLPMVRDRIDLVYHEAHRSENLEKECTLQSYRHSIWLSMLRAWSSRSLSMLSPKGFYALQVDDASYHYGRMCLDEVFGASNYVCTLVWQKKYGPQNDLNVPTAAQDYIIVYSKSPADQLPVMGFTISDDLTDDGDPRGPWVAGHKGAKSGSEETKFEVNAPPYRWELLSGQLPPGSWRVNKFSGVIWAKEVTCAGLFEFEVRVTDAEGESDTKKIAVEIRNDGEESPAETPWLFADGNGISAKGKLKIVSPSTFSGCVGKSLSIALNAKGGKPYTFPKDKKGKPGSGRYWEFSRKTLQEAILLDDVEFGARGTALPSIKKHHSPEGRIGRIITWWPYEDYGKSEDASRHLNKLKAEGIIPEASLVAKPERLMLKLLELLAPKKDSRVLCLGDSTASMSSVCLKTGRMPFVVVGNAPSSTAIWANTGLPRLKAVLAGKDPDGVTSEVPVEDRGQGGILELEVGASLFTQDKADGYIEPDFEDYPLDSDLIVEALASLAGYVIEPGSVDTGADLDGRTCIVMRPGQSLSSADLEIFRREGPHRMLTLLYESTTLQIDELDTRSLRLLRYPEDLIGISK